MVDQLVEWKVNILFVVGGDGTQRGGRDIGEEAWRRGHKLAVVGVPKTIDNDMVYMDKSFGYETACAAAVDAIARGTYRGEKRAEWHWPGQADGPSFWLHRLLRSHFQR